MKLFLSLIILFLFSNCSFDDKTGIWKNENIVKKNVEGPYKDFKTIFDSKKVFEKTVNLDKRLVFILSPVIQNNQWLDPFYSNSNNTKNYEFNNNFQLVFKSKKLTNYSPSKKLLYLDNNVILNDLRGNIIVYSIKKKK